jgi:hypothetical protein
MEIDVRFSIDPISRVDWNYPGGRSPHFLRFECWRNRLYLRLWNAVFALAWSALPFGAPWYTGRRREAPPPAGSAAIPGRYPYGPALIEVRR